MACFAKAIRLALLHRSSVVGGTRYPLEASPFSRPAPRSERSGNGRCRVLASTLHAEDDRLSAPERDCSLPLLRMLESVACRTPTQGFGEGQVMFKNILLPTDGSELATRAVDQGIALAKAVGRRSPS